MSNNSAAAVTNIAQMAASAPGASPSPIVYITLIALAAGLVSGAAAYLTQPAQTDPAQPAMPRTPWYTFCLLGVIAAACVPLFLSVVESNLMEDILKGEGKMAQSLFIFLGLCLLTALTARAFLDSLSRRILQQMEELRERQNEAAQDRSTIRKDVAAVHDKVEKVVETVDEQEAEPVSEDMESVSAALSDEPALPINDQEKRVLAAMARKSFRTVGGLTEDSELNRDVVLSLLRELAKKRLAEPTTSRKSGGLRWMITPLGRTSLRA